MPNTRSEGARSTGAAIATVTIVAIAMTAANSAARRLKVHHRGNDQQRAGNSPPAHVADMRRESRVACEMQRNQTNRLARAKSRESSQEAPPPVRAERCNPHREIETDLKRGKEDDGTLRIRERRTG